MASIPSNGYAEVMGGTNNYSGSNSYDATCPRTSVAPVIGNDLTNKTYVDAATGGGIIGTLTDKGSFLTGDGTQPVIFDANPYQTALTTITVYDWNSLAIGQSRNFTTTVPTLIPLGAGITITYSGTDSIKGNVTAVAGTTFTLTITNLASAVYTPTTLLTTLPRVGAVSLPAGNTILAVTPAITAPIPPDIPANTIITQGVANINSIFFSTNFFITLSGTNVVRGQSNTQVAPVGVASSAIQFDGANGGCFFGSTQTPVITANLTTTGNLGQAAGSVFPDFVGSLDGYTLTYGTGSIVIDDDIALIADALSPTGLAWGVINAAAVGAVTSVSGGTSIVMSGTVPAPIVNLNITDTNANATYYPTFVAGVGTQALLADTTTTAFSINPNTGDFNVVDTLKLTQTEVAVGKGAGLTTQGGSAVAIGAGAGNNSQGGSAIAIGDGAGATTQGTNSIALGQNAGTQTSKANCIAIGLSAGQFNQGQAGSASIAIGESSGNFNQGSLAVAVGAAAGRTSQGEGAVAISYNAGETSQGIKAVAIGYTAGQTSQALGCVAIGAGAGLTSQATNSVAIGGEAGETSQSQLAVAIGKLAGRTTQGTNSVAIGNQAGETTQNNFCVAIGNTAGQTSQALGCVAIGSGAGLSSQATNAVAIGGEAGKTSQATQSVAIGKNAAQSSQGQDCIAVGFQAAQTSQGLGAIAIGHEAGKTTQGIACIAIGYNAGKTNQGQDAIAIGSNAATTNQPSKSICINASGAPLPAGLAGCFIKPIRGVALGLGVGLVFYDSATSELQYSTN